MEWLVFIIVVIFCSAITWYISSMRTRSVMQTTASELEGRARAAEARSDELRQQIEPLQQQIAVIQTDLRTAESAKVIAETRGAEMERGLQEQKTLLEEAKVKLSDTFKSLAAEALQTNNDGFLTLATERLTSLQKEASTDLENKQKAIEGLITPLQETLVTYQKEARILEEKRLTEMSTVGEQLRSLAVAQNTLQNETAKLVNALRAPHVRGRWGEIALRKTAELAGMSAYCDFVEQESVSTEDGRLRPDMIVKLPAGRELVVDSKVSLSAYLDALEAKTDEEREAALLRHAAQIRQHVTKLSSKEYWSQFQSAPEFVVLFIPNDTFLAAAAEKAPDLVEFALIAQVVIATPTTFIALLRAIAYGWRQEQVTENAQKISTLGQELHDRIATMVEHLSKLGGSLGRAVDSFNDAIGSFEGRVLPSVRRFKELGAGSKKEVEELSPIDHTPRALNQEN